MRKNSSGPVIQQRIWQLALLTLLTTLLACGSAMAFTLNVVDPNNDPVIGFRWLVEEDNTTLTIPQTVQINPPSISLDIHKSHAPVVAQGRTTASSININVPSDKRYFVSVLPDDNSFTTGHAMGGTSVAVGDTVVEVTVNPMPIPTAQISVLAFVDHNPINAAKDEHEDGIGGATVVISDAAGQLMQNAFGHPLGTTYQREIPGDPNSDFLFDGDNVPLVDQMGTGLTTLTRTEFYAALGLDPDGVTPREGGIDENANPEKLRIGEVHVKYLVPGKYGVVVTAPGFADDGTPMTWVQTSTIEGTQTVDAWVKANEPELFVEGFGTGFNHAFFGFVKVSPTEPSTFLGQTVNVLPWNITDTLDLDYVDRSGFTGSLQGTLRVNHFAKPPELQGFYPGPTIDECWVGLNDPIALAEAEQVPIGGEGGVIEVPPVLALYAASCDGEGNFLLENLPPGDYQLVTWDTPLDTLIGYHIVTVPPGGSGTGEAVDLGDVLNFRWFGTLQGTVFNDVDQDGFRDPGEAGIAEQNVNIRFRDGTIYQAQPTDVAGGYELSEVFPFFKWLVPEVDFARFKATGMTTAVDDGGMIPDHSGWTIPSFGKLNPQPQATVNPNTGNNLSRTETGPVLTQAMHLFLSQTNVIDWGKAPYGPGENGGISGVVFYAVTRAEDDPRYAAGEEWEPGIPRVHVALYQDSDANGVIDDLNGDGLPTLADVDNHPLGNFPGPEDQDRNGNGLYDAGDAIQITSTDSWDDNPPSGCVQKLPVIHGETAPECADSFGTWNQVRPGVFDGGYAFDSHFPGGIASGSLEADGLPTGNYIVEVAVPPGYELLKEEDKNVDFGEIYTPSTLLLPPVCVGDPHQVPLYLSFDGVTPAPYANEIRPLCNRKQVEVLNDDNNAAADFFFFTQVPKAARAFGFVNNDLAAEFNQASPIFGEKSAAPWIPVSFKDWTGREITRVYADEFGHYNTLLPSTFTINAASPTGVSPNMVTLVLNDPVLPNGDIDPFYNPTFSVTPWTFNYTPGATTYLDTPLVPLAAFSAADVTLDTQPQSGVPGIATLAGPDGIPIICSNGEANITITSVETTEVPNPAYDPTLPDSPPTLFRDFGFGSVTGSVTLNGTELIIDSWTNSTIIAIVPTEATTGTIQVTRGDTGLSSEVGVTLTISDCGTPPLIVDNSTGSTAPFDTIQAAIDAAEPGALILVAPGTYHENVIMNKPVQLQGAGAGSTFIFANPSPRDRLQAWHAFIEPPDTGLNGQALEDFMLKFPFSENEAPGIFVTGEQYFPNGTIVAPGDMPWANVFNPGNSFTTCADPGGPIDDTGDNTTIPIIPTDTHLCDRFISVGDDPGAIMFVPGNITIPSRIDGFTISGATGGGGIFVFAGARGLVISNNEITNNQANYAGGISVGTPDAGFEIFDEGDFRLHTSDFQNLNITIRGNKVHKNAGFQGAGGIAMAEGAHDYLVEENLITGNFGRFNGGGIAHVGLSDNGMILDNRILFNETFFSGLIFRAGDGGGIFIAGDAVTGGTGSGSITIDGNLIQGNLADGGFGGGIRAYVVSGRDIRSISNPPEPIPDVWPVYRLTITNNMIVNNVAGLSGGAISLQDAAYVDMFNNTIANNDSTATAALAFDAGALNSNPQPAGIVSGEHSAQLQDLFLQAGAQELNCPTGAEESCVLEFLDQTFPTFSDPTMVNNIIWHNRSFFNDASLNGGAGGLAPNPAGLYWDLAVIGTDGQLSPKYSILSDLTGLGGENYVEYPEGINLNNLAAAPSFLLGYSNLLLSGTVTDEGGNYISILFTPLNADAGDYHINLGSPAMDSGAPPCPTFVPDDFDGDLRPVGPAVDIGADEITYADPTQLAIFSPNGDEVIPAGSTYQISWLGTLEGVDTYELYYTPGNGEPYQLIDTILPDTILLGGCYSYDWTVPGNAETEQALIGILARDEGGNIIGRDISDAPFTIKLHALVTPQTDDVIDVIIGTPYEITWTTPLLTDNPAATVALLYRIGSAPAQLIQVYDISTIDPGSHSWNLDWVTETITDVTVSLVFADANGQVLLVDSASNLTLNLPTTAGTAAAPAAVPTSGPSSASSSGSSSSGSSGSVATLGAAIDSALEAVAETELSTVLLLTPNGFEAFSSGEAVPILWDSPASETDVAKVEVLVQYGAEGKWQSLGFMETDAGFLDWMIPSDTKAIDSCLVQVRRIDAKGTVIDSDVSDEPFAIVPE